MALGILILRLAGALVAVAHGTQKLFGWLSGGGLEETGRSFEEIGLRPGRLHALGAGVAEVVGGLLLATSLLAPLGVAAIVGVMAAAAGRCISGTGSSPSRAATSTRSFLGSPPSRSVLRALAPGRSTTWSAGRSRERPVGLRRSPSGSSEPTPSP